MKKLTLMPLFLLLFIGQILANPLENPNMSYKMVVEGFDWGPAVNKVILNLDENVQATNVAHFKVFVKRKSDAGEIPQEQASGTREVLQAFVSDENGKRTEQGNHITLILGVSPNLSIASLSIF